MASPGSSSRGGLSEDDLVITFPGRQTFVASEFRAELQQQYYTYAIITMTGRGVVDAAIGAVLLGVGVLAHGAPCDVALARWAVVFGAVLLVLGPGSLAVGTAAACRRDAMDALGLSIATGVVSAVNFSLIAWGAVLAFGGGRWDAMMARSPQAPLPCTPSLYTPTAIALVIAWVFLVVVVAAQVVPFALTRASLGILDRLTGGHASAAAAPAADTGPPKRA